MKPTAKPALRLVKPKRAASLGKTVEALERLFKNDKTPLKVIAHSMDEADPSQRHTFLLSPRLAPAAKAPLFRLDVASTGSVLAVDLPPRLSNKPVVKESAVDLINARAAALGTLDGRIFAGPWWKMLEDAKRVPPAELVGSVRQYDLRGSSPWGILAKVLSDKREPGVVVRSQLLPPLDAKRTIRPTADLLLSARSAIVKFGSAKASGISPEQLVQIDKTLASAHEAVTLNLALDLELKASAFRHVLE